MNILLKEECLRQKFFLQIIWVDFYAFVPLEYVLLIKILKFIASYSNSNSSIDIVAGRTFYYSRSLQRDSRVERPKEAPTGALAWLASIFLLHFIGHLNKIFTMRLLTPISCILRYFSLNFFSIRYYFHDIALRWL